MNALAMAPGRRIVASTCLRRLPRGDGMSGKLLLCVDDDRDFLQVLQVTLEVSGYNVLTARDAPTALALFSELPVDLVVLDYTMPKMNGAEVARSLRQRKPTIPILMLSAHVERPADVHGLIDDYAVKAEENASLVSRIERLLADSSEACA